MLAVDIQIPGVRLGLVEAEGVRVQPVVPELAREMDAACERIRRELTLEQLVQHDTLRRVRALFRAWGVDPARYRPSSEALLRRVVQGKGLYRISNVVDINNLGSVETAWPSGSYDLNTIQPAVELRLGRRGETYEGIGRQTWHPEGRPVLADSVGPFGSPISDSTRTMVQESTRSVFSVFYIPAEVPDSELQPALELHASRLVRFAGAARTQISVAGPSAA